MNVGLIKKIDFGEIDGYGDPNLERYFLDDGYWDKIVNNNVFFVVGKKGTGKSSIYRMIEREAINYGDIVINKDFGEFPFEKLLRLNDDNFAKPNQYQTIWKNVILNLFVQTISKLPEENNDYYQEIKKYQKTFLGNVVDIHKDIISKATKRQGTLLTHGIDIGFENEEVHSYKCCSENITVINSALMDLIINYMITTQSERKVIIQFDRLDDNYNQYQNIEEYYQAIISLFKVVYSFNQLLRSKSIHNNKVIIYIRTDIIRELASRDAESARWNDFRFDLEWKVNRMQNIKESALYKMVEKRICTSCEELSTKSFEQIFVIDYKTKKECKIAHDLFSGLVLQTLFRPRDLINLLKTLQTEIVKRDRFDNSVYVNSQKKYSDWLVSTELANEINPILGKDYKYVIELLRLCGSQDLSVKIFTERYNAVKYKFNLTPLELLNFLYNVGMIENTWKDQRGRFMHRSIFRNEGDFDRNLRLRIIPAVWNGLNV